MAMENKLVVFTKSWKADSIEELADRVAALGFNGVELPVRDGYQVNPSNFETALPKAFDIFASRGLRIFSVAGEMNELLIRSMGGAGGAILRVMLNADPKKPYIEQESEHCRKIESLLPALKESGVVLGAQNHYGNFIGCSAAGLMRVVGRFPAAQVGAVLDLAHCAIAGEIPEFALDIASSHLAMVNLKCGYRGRTNFPTAIEAEWRTVWTSARHGTLSWKLAVDELGRRKYAGPICLTAEYSGTLKPLEEEEVMPLIEEDLSYFNLLKSFA